jgi:hypothetical protein
MSGVRHWVRCWLCEQWFEYVHIFLLCRQNVFWKFLLHLTTNIFIFCQEWLYPMCKNVLTSSCTRSRAKRHRTTGTVINNSDRQWILNSFVISKRHFPIRTMYNTLHDFFVNINLTFSILFVN